MVEIINKEVKLFRNSNGKELFVNWLEKLANVTRRVIENRIAVITW